MLKALLLGSLMIFSTAAATTLSDQLKTADLVREQGDTLKALALYDQILNDYQKEKDYNGVFAALNGQFIAWKHRFYETGEPLYAFFVMQRAQAMKYLAEKYGLKNKQHIIHYQLGNAHLLFDHYVPGEQELAKAVELYPENNAEKGDWMAHHGFALYRSGNKTLGKAKILEGIKMIQDPNAKVDSFRRHVWLSGAFRRLSELLSQDDPKASRLYRQQAEAIIQANPELVIRARQMEKLKEMEK